MEGHTTQGDGGAHSDNLVDVEGAHLAPIHVGAGPFWVEHCEEVAVEKLREKGLKEGGGETRRSGGGGSTYASRRERRGKGGRERREGDSGGVGAAAQWSQTGLTWWREEMLGVVGGWPPGMMWVDGEQDGVQFTTSCWFYHTAENRRGSVRHAVCRLASGRLWTGNWVNSFAPRACRNAKWRRVTRKPQPWSFDVQIFRCQTVGLPVGCGGARLSRTKFKFKIGETAKAAWDIQRWMHRSRVDTSSQGIRAEEQA
jgi:hypothetical protein